MLVYVLLSFKKEDNLGSARFFFDHHSIFLFSSIFDKNFFSSLFISLSSVSFSDYMWPSKGGSRLTLREKRLDLKLLLAIISSKTTIPTVPPPAVTKTSPLSFAATSASYYFLLNHDLHLLPSQTLFLESFLSSTSSSLSKLLSFHSISPLSLPPEPALVLSPLAQCWFQRFLSSASADYDTPWSHFLNISKPSFTLLLTPFLSSLSPLSPNYALASALFRLAHSASFSAVARRFNMDSVNAYCAFYTVWKGINYRLCHLFEFKFNRVIVGFGWISLPNCCGILGLERFQLDGDLLDENGSLIVQALVDSEGRFLDVSAGWPSTVAPSSILRQSKFFSGVEKSKEYLQGPSFELSDGNSIPQYILGDSCFPLLPWF